MKLVSNFACNLTLRRYAPADTSAQIRNGIMQGNAASANNRPNSGR
jgi:hypothetical protein